MSVLLKLIVAVFVFALSLVTAEVFIAVQELHATPAEHCVKGLPAESIPFELAAAVLAQEDTAFFDHCGINLYELFESIKLNLKQGKVIRGASTIEMQVAAICFDHTGLSFRWYSKARESLLALLLSLKFSKLDILKMYLSGAPLGQDASLRGFIDAALFYYNKPLHRLNQRETWSLVTTLRNRNSLDPISTSSLKTIPRNININLAKARKRKARNENAFRHHLKKAPWMMPEGAKGK